MVEQRINSEVQIKVLIKPMINPLSVSPSKGNQVTTHKVKKKSFDSGGNRTHDLRIRSTVTLPTELRGRTEKVGDAAQHSYAPLLSLRCDSPPKSYRPRLSLSDLVAQSAE